MAEVLIADDKLLELGFKLVSATPRVGAWMYENPDDDHEVEIDFDGKEWFLHSNTISHDEDCFGQLFNRPVGLRLVEMWAFMAKIEELGKEINT